MAKWTTMYFGPYWPSSGCLKRTGLGSTCIAPAHVVLAWIIIQYLVHLLNIPLLQNLKVIKDSSASGTNQILYSSTHIVHSSEPFRSCEGYL